MKERWAVGVDLGGTKLVVAGVDGGGEIRDSLRMPTKVEEGVPAVERDIVEAVRVLTERAGTPALGVGIGIAGQIDGQSGTVRFAPNLNWREVPLRADLEEALEMAVVVTNDVRAATWGEWLHGAGRGYDDLICLYVGTGIGGGIVSGGRMVSGCTNTAGEIGHLTVDIDGPPCTCGNRGCLEALAGGWAIARQAQEMIDRNPEAGRTLLAGAGGVREAVSAETVAIAAHGGDGLSLRLLDDAGRALTAGCVSLVNTFNPCMLILGGGVIDGLPEMIDTVRRGVAQNALAAATSSLRIVPAALGPSAGVVGAAGLVTRGFGADKEVLSGGRG
ncbi:MAG: ROK family protein [Syntrophorhabdales bacterium]|jgi:glucokinase